MRSVGAVVVVMSELSCRKRLLYEHTVPACMHASTTSVDGDNPVVDAAQGGWWLNL